jgi:hypothetical protein
MIPNPQSIHGSLGCENCDGREGALSGGLAIGGSANVDANVGQIGLGVTVHWSA